MTDDRNFRYGYYEKVGFRGVEEKKSLDILLKEKPNDLLAKLSHFTARFSLPGTYRMLVWKFLLGVTHPRCEDDDFVVKEQHAVCGDLRRTLTFMLYCDGSTPNKKLLLMMFLLQDDNLDAEFDKQLMNDQVMDLLIIADVLSKEFISDKIKNSFEDTYWLFRNLIFSIRNHMNSLLDSCEKFVNGIAQDDKHLYDHLVEKGVITPIPSKCFAQSQLGYKKFKNLPMRPFLTWFIRFYAGIIHENFLIKVFDRVIGSLIHGTRAFLVLIHIGKGVLGMARHEILMLTNCDEIKKRLIQPLTIEQSEEIITNALHVA